MEPSLNKVGLQQHSPAPFLLTCIGTVRYNRSDSNFFKTFLTYMWPDLRKGVSYTHPIFQLWQDTTQLVVQLLLQNFVEWILQHQTTLWPNVNLIALLHIELCFFKVVKSDACIRHLFTNPVTYWTKSNDEWLL